MPTLQESLEVLSINKPTAHSLNSDVAKDATSIQNPQRAHRINLLQAWLELAQENDYDLELDIVGKQTLDIGCGQGDMIELFATALKAQGNNESKVVGVDPADHDYGESV
jgi:2-polyprenyl-3-methyl-5-hydroxy-6-metoxy-1,4-benzoquinol methylase